MVFIVNKWFRKGQVMIVAMFVTKELSALDLNLIG